MSDKLNTIKTLYDSGAYFTDAKEWFQEIYVKSIPRRNAYIFIVIFLTLCGLTGALIWQNLSMHVNIVAMVISKGKNQLYNHTISPINYNPNTALNIAHKLIYNYVKDYEEYVSQDIDFRLYLERKINIIKNNSSRNVFYKFIDETKSSDKIKEYFYSGKNRRITIKSIEFLEDINSHFDKVMYFLYPGKIPKHAQVTFMTSEDGVQKIFLADLEFDIKIPQAAKTKKEYTTKAQKYLAGIDVNYSPIIQFTILEYRSKPINLN